MEDEQVRKAAEEVLKKKLSPETRARNRKIKRNMGVFMYYLAPCFRAYYDPTKEPDEEEDVEESLENIRKENIKKIVFFIFS